MSTTSIPEYTGYLMRFTKLFKDLDRKVIEPSEYIEMCEIAAGEEIKLIYGEENINMEMVDIFPTILPTTIRYGNLYSYLLVRGINIPYTDFVYENEYIKGDIKYKWFSRSGRGVAIKNRSTKIRKIK